MTSTDHANETYATRTKDLTEAQWAMPLAWDGWGCFLTLAGLAIDFSPLRMNSGRTFGTLWLCITILGLFRGVIRLGTDFPGDSRT